MLCMVFSICPRVYILFIYLFIELLFTSFSSIMDDILMRDAAKEKRHNAW